MTDIKLNRTCDVYINCDDDPNGCAGSPWQVCVIE